VCNGRQKYMVKKPDLYMTFELDGSYNILQVIIKYVFIFLVHYYFLTFKTCRNKI